MVVSFSVFWILLNSASDMREWLLRYAGEFQCLLDSSRKTAVYDPNAVSVNLPVSVSFGFFGVRAPSSRHGGAPCMYRVSVSFGFFRRGDTGLPSPTITYPQKFQCLLDSSR